MVPSIFSLKSVCTSYIQAEVEHAKIITKWVEVELFFRQGVWQEVVLLFSMREVRGERGIRKVCMLYVDRVNLCEPIQCEHNLHLP
jgi:hypothetical protein